MTVTELLQQQQDDAVIASPFLRAKGAQILLLANEPAQQDARSGTRLPRVPRATDQDVSRMTKDDTVIVWFYANDESRRPLKSRVGALWPSRRLFMSYKLELLSFYICSVMFCSI